MSVLQRFLFDAAPVRGSLVRLDDAWLEIQRRHQARAGQPDWSDALREVAGQLAAAALLLQSALRFEGDVLLQIQGDGPLRLAVVEVGPDFALRLSVKCNAEAAPGLSWADLVHAQGQGRCALVLDATQRQPDQPPYQGVVSLSDDHGRPFADLAATLSHYMARSEQVQTVLVLAADAQCAVGLMLQRMPLEGQGNLAGQGQCADPAQADEDWARLALLARSLKPAELLQCSPQTVLHRLFWQESLRPLETLTPRFACRCSRARVSRMIEGLGWAEAQAIVAEMGHLEVGCDFCGQAYRFDAVDVAQLFRSGSAEQASSDAVH